MSVHLYDAVEVCMKLMEKGASIDECLEGYPTLTEKLRPILEAVCEAKGLSEAEVPLEAMNRSRTRLLGKAAQMRKQNQVKRAWMGIPRLVFSLLILVVLLITTSGGLFAASAESLPGDTLYPVKRAVADLRVNLATGTEHKSEIETKYRLQRINEVNQLLDLQLVRKISFEGLVEKVAADYWIVSGFRVQVNSETVYIGSMSVGTLVEVEGTTELEGYVLADEIHLREYQMTGLVEKMERKEWTISGVAVKINTETQLGLGIVEGDVVLALISSDDENTLTAKAILNLGEPTATSTAQPTITATSELTGQTNQGDETTEDEDSEDDSNKPTKEDKENKVTKTPKPKEKDKDDSEAGDEEVTPEPEDESDPDDKDKTEEPESTPTPDD